MPILSFNILLPVIVSLIIMCMHNIRNIKYVAIISTLLSLLISLYLYFNSYCNSSYVRTEEYFIANLNPLLQWQLSTNGLSNILILLTSFLTFITVINSVNNTTTKLKQYLICLLLIQSFCIGVFSADNLLLFYLFFEVSLVPMYFMIGIWGAENRLYAATKFFLYTFLGSIIFLVTIFYIYANAKTLYIPHLVDLAYGFSHQVRLYIWLGIFVGFAIKIPMLPIHTWLPDAHVQAPTEGSMILAGLMLKLGAYGFLKVLLPLLPDISRELASYVIIASMVAVIYASLVAYAQKDMKKMIAYSSISHMGYVTAGIFSFNQSGFEGAIFQMISHGLISAALFMIIGVLYIRGHSKRIDNYGGCARQMPKLAFIFMLTMLASIGLPGTSGFIGEFYAILSMGQIHHWSAVLSLASGMVLSALYMLFLYKNTMYGQIKNEQINYFADLKPFEYRILSLMIICILGLGLVPKLLLKPVEETTIRLTLSSYTNNLPNKTYDD